MNPIISAADTLHARAEALLQALGDTPEQVAATLEQHHCHGVAGNCTTCPVAVYLMRSDLGLHHVAVGDDDAHLFTGGAGEHDIRVDLPDPVTAFIFGFDLGEFAQLRTTAGAR